MTTFKNHLSWLFVSIFPLPFIKLRIDHCWYNENAQEPLNSYLSIISTKVQAEQVTFQSENRPDYNYWTSCISQWWRWQLFEQMNVCKLHQVLSCTANKLESKCYGQFWYLHYFWCKWIVEIVESLPKCNNFISLSLFYLKNWSFIVKIASKNWKKYLTCNPNLTSATTQSMNCNLLLASRLAHQQLRHA